MRKFIASNINNAKIGLIDSDDYDLVINEVNLCSYGYARLAGVRLHRIIMERIIGGEIPKDKVVDHINRNRLDNRRCNLRLCSVLQNNLNKSKIKHTSIFTGVSWKSSKNKWYAQIKSKGIVKYLGLFTCEMEAAKKYNEEAVKLFGDFAVLNTI